MTLETIQGYTNTNVKRQSGLAFDMIHLFHSPSVQTLFTEINQWANLFEGFRKHAERVILGLQKTHPFAQGEQESRIKYPTHLAKTWRDAMQGLDWENTSHPSHIHSPP